MEANETTDDESSYEFSTLKCQWSLTDSPTESVHLKVAFCDGAADDQARKALRATAIVNTSIGDYVAYTGFVTGDRAADQSLHSGVQRDVDKPTAIRIWLRDSRAALVRSGDEPTVKYEYHLQRGDDNGDRLITLAWKIKLDPFGLATLGMVRMREVTPTTSVMCTSFITPLICLLSAERKRQELSDLAAAERERRQSEDNHRLLNEVRSMVDGRRLDDQRLMARFVEVLNAKKQRIADLRQELAELKSEQTVPQPVVVAVEQDKVVSRRRRGRGSCRGRPRSIKKIKQCMTGGRDMKWNSSSSGDENASLRRPNNNIQCPEPMEIGGLNGINISGNVVSDVEETLISTSIPASLTAPVSPIIPVSTSAENIPVDPKYLADTQIDSPDSSPTWLQQPLTVSSSSQLQPSINQRDGPELPKKKSVLDDLWSGIL
ncbi:uncharacterized protein LOC112596340 [Melanaphis sacchari]|uniref:uncharacterized protein LOC112596340 n=1 Tax=Melanaphis sacchari TaxID=742174 RepID=UPI000DC131FD|nr:uncharacterized protein LOC112596340 [Melanaphis sacchari]